MMESPIHSNSVLNANGINNAVDNDCPRFRPFVSHTHRVTKVKKAKYSTSLDPRGYIPVYEYLVNGQPIMWDRESGYVHFTGIWKALGNSKADIVKMVDSNPELKVKKIRGGFLKIQGTWIPYEYAYILCKRTAWLIRKELVGMFGPRFVNEALDPAHQDYGCLLLDPSQKGNNIRRNSFTTMRQSTSHPYKREHALKREYVKRTHNNSHINSNPNNNKQKSVSSMSLSRLLNNISQVSDMVCDDGKAFSGNSPTATPSPTFRVIPSFEQPWKEPSNTRLLPPIYTGAFETKRLDSEPRITPVFSPTWSPVSPVSSESSSATVCDKDIIDTINATILLQRLSQDDGARPFKPMHTNAIPSKVMVGNQEFRICWDN